LHGIESTIVAVENQAMRILRSGPITNDMLAEYGPVLEAAAGNKPEAPGQLPSHYAPRTPLRLIAGPCETGHTASVAYLAWRARPPGNFARAMEILSPSGDLREAAATLFAKLRQLDESGVELIVAEHVPEHGLGVAIMDRLRKAAAPR
jgi:L-threonylcarbamoyladenylate synthase